ncbi:MAG TPA: hypothetical protein VEC99_07590 [Clostridia bacterium]|nr:hypothetical protein [Clostridia bacterium]
MRGTHVNICWKAGIELAPLLRRVEAFAGRHELTLMPSEGRKPGYLEPWGRKPYGVKWWRNQKIESVESDDPAALNPLSDPDFAQILWELYDRNGKYWFAFSITQDPDAQEKSVKAGRVHRLFAGVDETFSRLAIYVEEVEPARKKYHQLRELFGVLDADTAEGADDMTGTLLFRFSTEGEQVMMKEIESA